METEWELVLETSFWKSYEKDPKFDTDRNLNERSLQTPAQSVQYLKFQVISWLGDRGGLQYIDIVRKPKLERSGLNFCFGHEFCKPIFRIFLYQEFGWTTTQEITFNK